MSPALRRYLVLFSDYALFETTVLAANEREAAAKAEAMYALNGVRDFDASIVKFKPRSLSVVQIKEEASQ